MNLLLRRPVGSIVISCMRKSEKLPEFIRTKKTVSALVVEGGGAQKKESIAAPKITLVHNQSVTITTLREAQKLAKRRDLHLLKQQDVDAKTQRPVYKLVTESELLTEDAEEYSAADKRKSVDRKSEKSLTIGSRISDNDLNSRLKQITKWLRKNHEICVFIQASPEETANCEKIVKAIEQNAKESETHCKVVQKRAKGSCIQLNIIPISSIAPVATA